MVYGHLGYASDDTIPDDDAIHDDASSENTIHNDAIFWVSCRSILWMGWLSGIAVACQRCRASDQGSVPGSTSGR